MKILSIAEYSFPKGTGQTLTVNLDKRSGVYFKVHGGTFETPYFNGLNTTVPVNMLHMDREQENVELTLSNYVLTIYQGYNQASTIFITTYVNEDWTDTSELKPVTIDATKIKSITLNNGQSLNVSAYITGINVRVRPTGFIPSGTVYYSQDITTIDNKTYIFPIQYTSHQINNDPIQYDYIYADINRIITAYTK